MAETSTVIGVFEDHNQAEQAIRALRDAGFKDDQVGFMVRHKGKAGTETREGAGVVAGGVIAALLGVVDALLLPVIGPTDASNVLTTSVPVAEGAIDRLEFRNETKKEEGESAGKSSDQSAKVSDAGEGTATANDEQSGERDEIVGATTGAVLGGAIGAAAALLIPGIGPVVAGGILVTALGSAAIGAMTGGLIGTFVGIGVPEHAAHQYKREFEAGRTIVTVKTDSRQQEAIDILRRNGAQDVQAH